MEESILTSTKKLLNVDSDDTSFDLDIITHINSAFSHLQQLGVGPSDGFQIEDDSATWDDFVVAPLPALPTLTMIKTNIFMRVRLIFDPPAAPPVLTSMEKLLEESDWRISMFREATLDSTPTTP